MRRLIPCVMLLASLTAFCQQTPQQLVTAAGSFRDLSQRDMDVVKTYLMTIIALGTTPTPASLVTSAAAFRQLSSTDLQVIQTYLLNQISTASGGTNVISINAAAGGAAVNSAVTNSISGQIINLGPGVFTNQALYLPAGVSIQGAGRGRTILYFTNATGFTATAGWLMASNNNRISDLTIAPIPDGTWKAFTPVVVCDNASNVVFSQCEIIGWSDLGVWFNTSQASFYDCHFETCCDGWTDADGAAGAGSGFLGFYGCDVYAHMSGLAQGQSCNLNFISYTSNSSTNTFIVGCSVLLSNTPTVAQGGTAFAVSGKAHIVGMSVDFQRTNNNPVVYAAAGGASINGHPYPDAFCGTVSFVGDATNAPISGAFMQSSDALGYRRWVPNTNSPGPFTIASGAVGLGSTGTTNSNAAQFNYLNLQFSTNAGWGGVQSNGVANSTLTLKGFEEFVMSMGNTIVQLGDATTNLGHHVAITCGSAGTNAIKTVNSQKIAGLTAGSNGTGWTNTAIWTCTQLISDGTGWQICGSRGN